MSIRDYLKLLEKEAWEDHTDIDDIDWDNPWKPSDGIKNHIRDMYSHGRCMYLAMVLHQMTKWPIFVETDGERIMHCWVVNTEGKAVDINGVHTTNHAKTKINVRMNSTGNIRQVSYQELNKKFGEAKDVLKLTKELVNHNKSHFGL